MEKPLSQQSSKIATGLTPMPLLMPAGYLSTETGTAVQRRHYPASSRLPARKDLHLNPRNYPHSHRWPMKHQGFAPTGRNRANGKALVSGSARGRQCITRLLRSGNIRAPSCLCRTYIYPTSFVLLIGILLIGLARNSKEGSEPTPRSTLYILSINPILLSHDSKRSASVAFQPSIDAQICVGSASCTRPSDPCRTLRASKSASSKSSTRG